MNNVVINIIIDEKEIDLLLNKSSFNYTYDQLTIDSLKKLFKLKNSLYLLAKSGEEFVGFCSTDRDWWEDNHFFLREILVNPNYQKLGIGQQLMERCIKHAKDNSAVGVVTETANDNYPMQKLCEKLSFAKWENPQWKEGITYKLLF